MTLSPIPFANPDAYDLMGYKSMLPGVWYPIDRAVEDEDVEVSVLIHVRCPDGVGLIIEAAWDKGLGWVRYDGTQQPLSELGTPSHVMFIIPPQVTP